MADSVHEWYNTEDAVKRPKDIIEGKSMRMNLPDDVVVKPSISDLNKLNRRMRSYDKILHRQRVESNPDVNPPTDSVPLPGEFGGVSTLIAIDRGSLGKLHKGVGLESSTRMPEVHDMVTEVPNPTHIPPIYIQVEKFHGGKRFVDVRDGQHRVESAMRNTDVPFLLAYVKNNDMEFLGSNGIVYRKVEAYP